MVTVLQMILAGVRPPPCFTTHVAATPVGVQVVGVLIFLYSYFGLFYLADWVDNGIRFKWSTLPVMLVSFVASMIIGAISQIVGLLRYRQQHTWVKTEHKLHGDESMSRGSDVSA